MPGRLWVTQLSEELSRRLSRIVAAWSPSDKRDIGDQIIRASESIGANLSEGYARVYHKERLYFYSVAQGSLEETLYWARRARDRGLMETRDAGRLSGLCIMLSKALANFVATQK